MPRMSKSYTVMSDAALGSLVSLGHRLKEARLRRNWTQDQTAQKAGLSESSVKKVEAGSVRITIGAYLSLLDIFGLPTSFDHVIAAGDDHVGEALSRSATRQRAGTSRQSSDDEWEI